ncbi:MAG: low molecular weight protein arginine phosphatase [bacterium]|nr:low molecular weight protein arginine phosphatase [bacterium]
MNILFVCTGNTCRSPMAAAVLSKIADDNDMDLMIDSAGIMAEDGAPASDNAISAMIEMRIDISNHRAHQITNDDIIQADLILTMTEGQKMIIEPLAPKKVFTLNEFAGSYGDISDPYGGDLEEYRETAQEIYDVMVDAAEKIADMINDDNN